MNIRTDNIDHVGTSVTLALAGFLFKENPNLWNKLKQGTESANAAMREGTQHTLEIFKKNPNKYSPENIKDLDMKFEEVLDDICSNCRFDVEFKPDLGPEFPRLVEFKSYSPQTWGSIKNSQQFLNQFKRYLRASEISNLDDLVYIINVNKSSLLEVKQAFKELFAAKSDEIFEAFNTSLKQDLDLLSINNLTTNKIDEILDIIIKPE